MKIVTDIKTGDKFTVEDAALTPYFGGNPKRAKVLKSFRTGEGAEGYLKIMKGRLDESAIIVKSLGDYDEVCDGFGVALPALPTPPVHIVVEEDMAPIIETVALKNTDELVKAMIKKGLLETNPGGVSLSEKFYIILNEFTKNAMNDYLKSATEEKTDDGKIMVDVISDIYEVVVKSAPGLALSQEEADNKSGSERAESLGDLKGAAANHGDGHASAQTGAEPAGKALTQEEADNKSGDTRTESLGDKKGAAEDALGGGASHGSNPGAGLVSELGADSDIKTIPISDAEVKSNRGEVHVTKSIEVFKSLADARAFSNRNPGYEVGASTIQEKNHFGKRYTFVARKISAK